MSIDNYNPHQNNQTPPPNQPIDSTDTIAMIIEIVFGFFGMVGVGWLYIGNYLNFIALFFGFWVLIAIETMLALATFGCLACIFYPLNVVLVIISGVKVRDHVRQHKAKGNIINVLILALLVICLAGCVILGLFATGGAIIRDLPPLPTQPPFLGQ